MDRKTGHKRERLYGFIQRRLMVIVLGCGLMGCSLSDQESFDCPIGKGSGKGSGNGIGCQSMTEIKKKLNHGEIEMPETTWEDAQKRGLFVPSHSFGATTPMPVADSNGFLIQRTPEKPLRVWIAPYQDQEGNLREASFVHTVIEPGSWQVGPTRDQGF